MFLHSVFMQQDQKAPDSRKPWYQKAVEAVTLWKPLRKSTRVPPNSSRPQKLKKCSSLRIASSFTHVCLCAPVSSYDEAFRTEATTNPPRRSYSYPRSRSYTAPPSERAAAATPTRTSVEGRRVFRGKSLTDDLLMRRFVVEEEAMMQVRRRNEMDVIRRRAAMRRRRIGPSPLSRMTMAAGEDDD